MASEPTRRMLLEGMLLGLGGTAATLLPFSVRAQGPDSPRRLTIAIPVGPDHFEPALLNATAVFRTASNLFDSLLAYGYGADMAVRPALASRWERADDRSVRFWLRPGVLFHDGSAMQAEDVAWSLGPDHLLGPNRNGAVVSLQTLDVLDGVAIEAPDRIVVSAKGPDALLERRLAAWSSQIMSRKAFERAGSWQAWQRAPVGTGPYKFADARMDSYVRFVRHDVYWGGLPPFEEITWRVVPEVSSRLAGLYAGDYDLVTDVPPDQFDEVRSHPGLAVVGGPIQNIRSLTIDTTAPVLSNVRVRRALSLAIDRKLIIDSLWHGLTEVPNGYQLPSYGDTYIADFPGPAYDPAEAKRLLALAGYKGEPITYKLLNYYPLQVQGAQAMVGMWEAVGLNVQIEMKENFSQVETAPIHAIYDNSNTALLPDPLGHGWRIFGPRGEMPYGSKIWSSAEYAELGTRLGNSVDPVERRRIARRLLEIVRDEAPIVILFRQAMFYAKRRNVPWMPDDVLITRFAP